MKGAVFDIQRFSVHDGPGIRTTVFLKGCPLRCAWCQNPEGLERSVRLWNFDNLCVGCGACPAVCPVGAIAMGADNRPVIDHHRCTRCGVCIKECLHNAMALDGYKIDSRELTDRLLADSVFFKSSGGGVTFSGGEPLAQAAFVRATAAGLRERGIHTAIETSMEGEWEELRGLIECIDFFQVDIKIFDAEAHLAATGAGNARILDNFSRLAGALRGSGRLKVRIPLVPGYTDGAGNLSAIASHMAATAPDVPVELMNFNPLATSKYRRMHLRYALADVAKGYSEGELEAMNRLVAQCHSYNR